MRRQEDSPEASEPEDASSGFGWMVLAVGIGVIAPNTGAESVAQAERAADVSNGPSPTGPVGPVGVGVEGNVSPAAASSDNDLASLGVKPSATPIPEVGSANEVGAIAGGSVSGLTPVAGAAGSASSGRCPENMVEVEGDYCPYLEQKCLRWLDPETKMRCAEFAPSGKCQSKTTKKHFCIDRYEWPNKVGEKPVVMGTWYQAKDACTAVGKRLCGDSEWTLACEGEEHLPYPYGYARNSDACNIDKPHPAVNEAALANPATRDAEAARLDQRDVSGSHESCVSPYGAFDMTGNVDEWVVNESGAPYKSGLKGGYWGPVRTRCRPMTTAHSEIFSFYQIGFRCCEDVPADKGAAGAKGAPNGAGAPGSHGAGTAVSPADNAARSVAGS